jgi:hypothetical protein
VQDLQRERILQVWETLRISMCSYTLFLTAPVYVTGPITTGTYLVTNARFLDLIVLRDANDGSDLVSGVQNDDPGEKVCFDFRG